jgi:hypothetical protein
MQLARVVLLSNHCVSEIYVMNADDSEQTNISNNPSTDVDSDWGTATDTEP